MKNKHSENQAVLLQRFGFTLTAAATVIWKAEDITFFTEAYFQPSKLKIFLNINIKQRWSSGGTRAKESSLTGLAKQTNEWSEGHCDMVVPPQISNTQEHRRSSFLHTNQEPVIIKARSLLPWKKGSFILREECVLDPALFLWFSNLVWRRALEKNFSLQKNQG